MGIDVTKASCFNGDRLAFFVVRVGFVNVSAFELKKKANSNLTVIIAVGNDVIGVVGMV